MLLRFLALTSALVTAATGVSVHRTDVPTGAGDAIFAVGQTGALAPVAVRLHGTFRAAPPGPDGQDDRLRMDALAAIATHGNRVHVIFGNRVVATLRATVADGVATIAVPPALRLGGFVTALASPTLGARASSARRAAAPAERSGALAVAAARLGTTPARLEVRNLAAIDLGRGIAVVGTLNLRGRAKPRVDHRLWFIAEQMLGRWTLTLANVQTITVSEPLLEEPSEYLIDALDLGGGSVGVVTRIIGYDAESYAIYTRRGAAWKSVYTGGGGAN
jgi:hypothetical protein